MATDSFEFDPVPGYQKPTGTYGTEFGDEFHAPAVSELLKSYARFTQRGVTLAGGQGLLKGGTVLARKTADKKYYLYAVGASDGTQTPLGILRDDRDTGGTNSPSGKVSTDILGNLVISGIVDLSLLSGTDTASLVSGAFGTNPVGGFGTATVNALNGRYDLPNSEFIF